ncbi:MAG TPA: preprotein translocase subunit SecG [Dehalococcoidia bacterium]|nr:preprotein translocase subunit SecG [Dehalococcoidia bacterium]
MAPIEIAVIIIAVALIATIISQIRGGGMSGIFGGGGEQAFRTRRGIEKTLFRFTVVLIVVFIVLCILSVRLT